MRVFISWSGPQSQAIAEAFHTFIGDCIQGVKPFVSSHNIDAGANWPDVLRNELKTTGFGVLCLTTENLLKPWILFEAGAISNALDKGIVCPYLFGLRPTDLQWPLAQFNANVADADDPTGTHKVVRSINTAMGAAGLDTNGLDRQFRRCWPEYQEALKKVPAAAERNDEEKPTFDMQKALEEILAAVRSSAKPRRFTELKDVRLPPVSKQRLENARRQALVKVLGRGPWRIDFLDGPLSRRSVGTSSEGADFAIAQAIAKATNLITSTRFRLLKQGDSVRVYKVQGQDSTEIDTIYATFDYPDYDAVYELKQVITGTGESEFVAALRTDILLA